MKTYKVALDKNKKPKKKLRRQNKNNSTLIKMLILLFLVLGLSGYGAYYLINEALECKGDCNPVLTGIQATIDPKLDMEEGLTNVLLVGIDTRDENPGLMNTDTMIVLTINYNNGTAMMTSIPRDLWVRYELPNGNFTESKINSAYANGEWQEKGAGIETLQNAVETVTGFQMQYHVKVTLAGFIEIIDTIDGVDVDIPEYYKDAYPASELPPEWEAECVPYYHDGKYCLYEFQEGTEHMGGQRALIYARSRLLSQRGDFDRAVRQQRVINAVKDKILSSETYLDPDKLYDIYNIVKDNIETSSFNLNDIRAAVNLRNKIDTSRVGKVVLDPTFGNNYGTFIYRPTDNPGRGYYIAAKDQTYTDIHNRLRAILENPLIYNEAPSIGIYNATGNPELERNWVEELEAVTPLFKIMQTNRVIDNPDDQYTGVRIYKFTEEDKEASEEFLKDFFGVDDIYSDFNDGTTNISGEDYVIVIGK